MGKKQTDKAQIYDVIIAGAGVAGLTLAVLMAQAGLKIAVIDPAREDILADDSLRSGRSVALMNESLRVLENAGVWPALQPRSNPLKTMTIIDVSRPNAPPITAPFESQDLGEAQYGFNIPNAALRAALFHAAKTQSNLDLLLETKLDSYVSDGGANHVTLDNGATLQARLLVGADGRESKVREIAGIETTRKSYDQMAITCVINHSKAHNDTSSEFHRACGPLALVPLPGNQSAVVWVNAPARAQELSAMTDSDFIQALQDESNDLLGGLTLETSPQAWPLQFIKAQSLTATRVALVAEAAHVMSPITAQGLNLSLRDVAALADTVIEAARLGQDIGNGVTLRSYAKQRSFDIDTRVFGVDHMNRLVSNDIEVIKGLRHAGLKTIEALPPLKRFAMRVGLAPKG